MDKAMVILSDLIEQHEPDVLAIKEIHPSRTSRNLNQLVGQIRGIARRKGLRIYRCSIKDLERFFSPEERINKRELAELVASEHPVLSHELNKEKAIRNPYYIRMFEAVALGSVCLHQLER